MTLKTPKEQMVTDLPVFFSTSIWGEEMSYTPTGGDAVTITAVPGEIDPSIMADFNPPADSLSLDVRCSEVVTPKRGDIFIWNTETWYLVRNIGGGAHAGIWKIIISRSEQRRI